MALVLDGKSVAETIYAGLERRVAKLHSEGVTPKLAALLWMHDSASMAYLRGIEKAAKRVGIVVESHYPVTGVTTKELENLIISYNTKDKVHGIILQIPNGGIAKNANLREACGKACGKISPYKDVDGMRHDVLSRISEGRDCFVPCTPLGIERLLQAYKVPVSNVVVYGSGRVGKFVSSMFSRKNGFNAAVTLLNGGVEDASEYTKQADLLIVAVGKPYAVTPEMVKEGAIVVDVGINSIPDSSPKSGYRIVGDVHPGVEKIASVITLVPGGVGPMTVAMLMEQTVKAAEMQRDRLAEISKSN